MSASSVLSDDGRGRGERLVRQGRRPAIGYERQKQRGRGRGWNVDERGQVVAEVLRLTFEAITADRAQNMRGRKRRGSDGNGRSKLSQEEPWQRDEIARSSRRNNRKG